MEPAVSEWSVAVEMPTANGGRRARIRRGVRVDDALMRTSNRGATASAGRLRALCCVAAVCRSLCPIPDNFRSVCLCSCLCRVIFFWPRVSLLRRSFTSAPQLTRHARRYRRAAHLFEGGTSPWRNPSDMLLHERCKRRVQATKPCRLYTLRVARKDHGGGRICYTAVFVTWLTTLTSALPSWSVSFPLIPFDCPLVLHLARRMSTEGGPWARRAIHQPKGHGRRHCFLPGRLAPGLWRGHDEPSAKPARSPSVPGRQEGGRGARWQLGTGQEVGRGARRAVLGPVVSTATFRVDET